MICACRPMGPLVLHGDDGYSVKSAAGQASYYYSQPFYTVEGTLDLPDGPVAVTGQAWLDREWSSQPLASDQTGWDWFSIVLDDGHRLMGFQLRGSQTFTAGTWITPGGQATPCPMVRCPSPRKAPRGLQAATSRCAGGSTGPNKGLALADRAQSTRRHGWT